MALDAQRNWTVSMAENFDKVTRNATGDNEIPESLDRRDRHGSSLTNVEAVVWDREPVHLPDEVIIQIVEYVACSSQAQKTLTSCCLLSHQWYSATVPLLYRAPYLYGKNFDPFVRTICPSINLHVRQSPLAELVRVLNMGSLVHHGSKSVTARLLGRTKNRLEMFIAPTATFSRSCFPALAKCHHLHYLDLSLVSESPPLPELFKTVANLERLLTFRLPRSSGFAGGVEPQTLSWPPNLEDLGLSGGIDAHFLQGVVSFPRTLRNLTIEHCPHARGASIINMLRNCAQNLPRLESLKLNNLPRLSPKALDYVLLVLPNLTKLSVSVDYITPAVFDLAARQPLQPLSSPTDPLEQISRLRCLELTNSGSSGIEDKITPIDIMISLDEGSLPNLRQVRAAKSLMWDSSPTKDDAAALSDALQDAAARRRAFGTESNEFGECGVWTFDDR